MLSNARNPPHTAAILDAQGARFFAVLRLLTSINSLRI
jgi:hypothetical protein